MGLPRFQDLFGGARHRANYCSGLKMEKEEVPVAGKQEHRASLPMAALVLMAGFAALYFARDFFIPFALALFLALVLSPAVQLLAGWHIPSAAGSAVVLVAACGLLIAGFLSLSGPVGYWIQKGPESFSRINARIEPVLQRFEHLKTSARHNRNQEIEPTQKVEVKEPGAIKSLMARMGQVITVLGTTFILIYFLLATGDALLGSILAAISNPARRAQTIEIGHQIKKSIAKYLLALTLVNFAEGGLIAGGLYVAGMPTPLLWGALHAVLNFIPYVGAITGLAITAFVAFISFESFGHALIPPAIYLAVMILDTFASPLILGKRLILNAALVFLSLMFWGWLWGLVGVLLAVPILIAAKIICDHLPGFEKFGRIISAHDPALKPPPADA
jgi:predicted PurR-regulated permease PerM